MIKTDCFAYNAEKKECNACRDLNCRNCKFYKEKSKYYAERTKRTTRITLTEKSFGDYGGVPNYGEFGDPYDTSQ